MAIAVIGIGGPVGEGVFFWSAVTGLPFGWRWVSKLITATSLKGIGIKMIISALVGCLAIYVVFAKDLICFLMSLRQKS